MKKLKSYLISDPLYFSSNKKIFEEKLRTILNNHNVDIACFRDKSSTNFEELAKVFSKLCKEFKVDKILINTNIRLAKKLGFDGVHLNSQQFEKIEFAKSLNLFTIISCHNHKDLEMAFSKKVDCASYSPIFASPNKGEPLGIEKLILAKNSFPNLKIIALGGIIDNLQIKEVQKTEVYGFASIRYFI